MIEFDGVVTDRRLRLAGAERHLAVERAGELLFGEYRVFASGGTTGERRVGSTIRPHGRLSSPAFCA